MLDENTTIYDLIPGSTDLPGVARVLKKSTRQVRRYEEKGLPYHRVGTIKVYVLEEVAAWVLNNGQRVETRRGRPRAA